MGRGAEPLVEETVGGRPAFGVGVVEFRAVQILIVIRTACDQHCATRCPKSLDHWPLHGSREGTVIPVTWNPCRFEGFCAGRSEERRGGQEWVGTVRSRWSQYNK